MFYVSFLASVGKSAGCYKTVSASVMEADGMFQGFSYVPPSEDAFSWGQLPYHIFVIISSLIINATA